MTVFRSPWLAVGAQAEPRMRRVRVKGTSIARDPPRWWLLVSSVQGSSLARWTAVQTDQTRELNLLLSTICSNNLPFVAITIMSDQCEEQEMEAEALSAIFDTAFQVTSDTQPFEWTVKLVPVDCGGDPDEEKSQNHVGINLLVTVPLDYPEMSLPELDVQILKGLTEEHRTELLQMARAEAANNAGMPAIFAICEVLREWLSDNNTRGLDDASMHAQMMRRALEEERKKVSQTRKRMLVEQNERVPIMDTIFDRVMRHLY